jgi:hypothetical protein
MTALLLSLALALSQEKPGAPEKGKVQERVTVDSVVVTGGFDPEGDHLRWKLPSGLSGIEDSAFFRVVDR